MNEFLNKIAARAAKLADMSIDELRSCYPLGTIRTCKQQGLERGEMIQAILLEEFWEEGK